MSRLKKNTKPSSPKSLAATRGRWWGEFEIPAGSERRWQIERSQLWLRRLPNEWWIARCWGDDNTPSAVEVAEATPIDDQAKVPDGADLRRVVFGQTDDTVEVRPALADRPVVTRPEVPLLIPSGEEVTFYAGTPLWLRVVLRRGTPPAVDEPLVAQPETWFGPSTLRGELCYLSRTHAHVNLANLEVPADRAITPVTVKNRATSSLRLERFKVPVPHFSLFEGEGNTLWTDPLIIERDDSGDLDIQLQPGAPAQATATEPLSTPRERSERLRMGRALSSLFG